MASDIPIKPESAPYFDGITDMGGIGPGSDEQWHYVTALLTFKVLGGQNICYDHSELNLPYTRNGNAIVDTDKVLWGKPSFYQDNTAVSYFTTPDNVNHDCSGVDFNVEFWMKPKGVTSLHANRCVVSKDGSSGRGWRVYLASALTSITFVGYWGGTGGSIQSYTVSHNFTPDAWTHVRLIFRSDRTSDFYVNGKKIGAGGAFGQNVRDTITPLRIGVSSYSGSEEPFNGWINSLRLTRNVRRSVYDMDVAPYRIG